MGGSRSPTGFPDGFIAETWPACSADHRVTDGGWEIDRMTQEPDRWAFVVRDTRRSTPDFSNRVRPRRHARRKRQCVTRFSDDARLLPRWVGEESRDRPFAAHGNGECEPERSDVDAAAGRWHIRLCSACNGQHAHIGVGCRFDQRRAQVPRHRRNTAESHARRHWIAGDPRFSAVARPRQSRRPSPTGPMRSPPRSARPPR